MTPKPASGKRARLRQLLEARFAVPVSITATLLFGVSAASSDGVRALAAPRSGEGTIPPSNTSLPTISGTVQQGQTITASSGSWSGTTPITFNYQWLRCDPAGASCATIAGATNQSYALVGDDVGKTMRVTVTASNTAGASQATSNQTQPVSSASAPVNTSPPMIAGAATPGQTVTATTGSWSGAQPLTFSFQWLRCDAANPNENCVDIGGATGQTYLVTTNDLGRSLRAGVRATNAAGSGDARSTSVAVTGVGAPQNTARPFISGTFRQGQTITAQTGSWVSAAPVSFSYQWQRCDGAGRNCSAVSGAVRQRYTLTAADVGRRMRVTVTATSAAGASKVDTDVSAVVAGLLPAGATRLPDGTISIPASSVALPERLVVTRVVFSPSVVRSRAPFTARFRVRDTRGFVVRDALVFLVGVPFGRINPVPEGRTGMDGWVGFELRPTAELPLRRSGGLVMFVRARKERGSLLAGISTRRLVQVRVGRAAA